MEFESPDCPSCGVDLLSIASAHDQRWSYQDQTAGDQDQTWADHDQSASDSDQRSADEDQQASDDDFSAGGDAITHRRSAAARERTSHDRAAVSELRDETGTIRLENSEFRDRTAEFRDAGTEVDARELVIDDEPEAIPEDLLTRARRDRARAAADRAKAADDRSRAAADRVTAAADRSRAEADRKVASRQRAEAQAFRTESAKNLKLTTTDELTGTWTRKFGLEELARELERAHRTGGTIVVAFVDVDGLKAVNDARGHLAGDALLRLVGKTLLDNVRPYDIVLRYGGDEFVCGMANLHEDQARARLEKIAELLTAADAEHSITFGLAQGEPDESLQELLARADRALLAAKQ